MTVDDLLAKIPPEVPGLLVALAIGLLIGVEREQRKTDAGPGFGVAGVRTFALFALTGAVAQLLGAIALAVAGAFTLAAAVAAFVRSSEKTPGLTTEVALVLVFLLGVLAMARPAMASALGVLVAVLLAAKSKLHDFANRTLSEQELHDLLLLAAAIAIVLPLLPEEPLDPWHALNLRRVWMLVVIVMAVNALGYIALRAFGARLGLVIAGLVGGFVSSTATTAAMGSRARQQPKLVGGCAAAALMANASSALQIIVIVGFISPVLLRVLWLPVALAVLAAVLVAVAIGWHAFRNESGSDKVMAGRAFKIGHALLFAAIVSVVLVGSAWAHETFGQAGYIVAVAAAGLADAHAPSGSVAQLVSAGGIPPAEGVRAVLAAFTAGSISKLVLAGVTGGPAYLLRLAPGIVAMNLAFGAAVLLAPGAEVAVAPGE